jgi:DNA-binding transcriptional ArsR family regulator
MDEVRLDGRQIRVLAHPLRLRLLGRLRLEGPATATRLAQALDTNTGATSYHLRQLADVGLVAEDDSVETRGRERWWRAEHATSSWNRDAFTGDPDAMAAAEWLDNEWLRFLSERVGAWHAVRASEPAEWRSAASFGDRLLELDAAQLTALNAEIDAVITRWSEQVEPGPGARQVGVFTYGMPWVEGS